MHQDDRKIRSGEFGFVVLVVKNPVAPEDGGKTRCDRLDEGAVLAWKGKSDIETLRRCEVPGHRRSIAAERGE